MSLKRSWLLKERVVLDQPSEGYRAGLDAVLLSHHRDRAAHIMRPAHERACLGQQQVGILVRVERRVTAERHHDSRSV